MTFVFQQPGTAKLLQAIDVAAANATGGGGVFAFASKGGIEAFFARPNFVRMLKRRGRFHLIVGIDAITNVEALLCLSEKLEQFPEVLTVNVFFHEYPASTFHPKFSWFKSRTGLHLLTGSGNMTLRGLGKLIVEPGARSGNWEAFSAQLLKDDGAKTANEEIEDWLAAQVLAGTLCSLDDIRVREKAMANGRVRFSTGVRRVRPEIVEDAPEPEVALVDGVTLNTPEIFIREIPKNRSGQADLGKKALTEFFGYEEGEKKKVFVQYVSLGNVAEPVEPILLFNNDSRNYRLELRTIAKLDYEIRRDDSRMIVVATKLDSRSFRYTILPVTARGYNSVVALLPAMGGGRRLMREAYVDASVLAAAWPGVPANLLPISSLTPEP